MPRRMEGKTRLWNKVIEFLFIGDMAGRVGLALLSPILAIFILDRIEGGNAAVAGIATTVALVTKSIFQIPAAALADRIAGERDDFWIMFGSSIVSAVLPLLLLVVHTPLGLYVVQFVISATFAFSFPTYMAIMTRHMPRGKEGTVWGTYFTLTDLCSAIGAGVGGIVAVAYGFETLIIAMTVIMVISSCLYLPIYHHLFTVKAKPILAK